MINDFLQILQIEGSNIQLYAFANQILGHESTKNVLLTQH